MFHSTVTLIQQFTDKYYLYNSPSFTEKLNILNYVKKFSFLECEIKIKKKFKVKFVSPLLNVRVVYLLGSVIVMR